MSAVGFDDFSGPCSELALPPLFGGNILESELEQEVEFADAGLNGDTAEEDGAARQRELYRKKYHALQRRCKEIETVNEKLLNRLKNVRKITQRLKKERRFLMKCLDSHGDSYRTAQLTILLEDEGSRGGEEMLLDNPPSGQLPEGEETPAAKHSSQGSDSPTPSEGGTHKRKRVKEEKEGPTNKRHLNSFYKFGRDLPKRQDSSDEELSPREGSEPLSRPWNTESPERKVVYGEYSSPAVYPEFD
ncbi:TCF3 fusion partner isoform X1 [Mobula birostris]|uniref:TCF3 fusion partner isoform X1 n=1 Tax=Mobula birostris TaxID=1983395 RepID=UPI003B27CD34